MSKILEIKNCAMCHVPKEVRPPKWRCIYLTKLIEGAPPNNHVAKDCPLQDKPEPITKKYFDRLMYEKDTIQEVIDEINAHFLGGKS